MRSIVQDWVQALGLRHQGVILTAIRGCDTAPRDDPSKLFTRCYRALVLNPHCGAVRKAVSFVEWPGRDVCAQRFREFRRNLDHYPHHYIMHLMHAIEIVGYKCPDDLIMEFEESGQIYMDGGGRIRVQWSGFYISLCTGMHVNPEQESALDARLNADEETFGRLQHGHVSVDAEKFLRPEKGTVVIDKGKARAPLPWEETYPIPPAGEPPATHEKLSRPAGFVSDDDLHR